MDFISFAVIAITCLISYKGFNEYLFFEKYKFNVSSIVNRKEYIRLVSSGFLHSNWMHLLFNMLSLYFFKDIIFYFFGTIGFLIIYFGALILGNILSLIIHKKQPWYSAIGASGAVSGIIFAAIAMEPHMKIGLFFIPVTGYIFGFLYFGYSIYMIQNPQQWDNLGHSAHLGGAIFGILYVIVLKMDWVIQNIEYVGIMSLPLLYLAYYISQENRKK